MKYLLKMVSLLVLSSLFTSTIRADGFDEVQEWRRRTRLPLFKEDPKMTQFALKKARYRAERDLQNNHKGPRPPKGWKEGTGEAKPFWGWLTCEMECDFQFVGAGMCVGKNGLRYMVFVGRGGSGRPLISRHNIPTYDTSYLTPNPPKVK